MFGENFGFDYYQQRHVELLREVERARLVRCLAQVQQAEPGRLSLSRRVFAATLGATGDQLVAMGSRLQQAAGRGL